MIKKPFFISVIIFSLYILLTSAALGCEVPVSGTSSTQAISQGQALVATQTMPTTYKPADPSTPVSSTPVPPTPTATPTLKTEVIYFHLTARCVTCICFEKNIKFVVGTYYEDAIRNGKMTFNIVNAQDKQNADIVKKYKAVGSQFFVNTIVNGIEHIKDIQAIWEWNCTRDPNGFNRRVKIIIDRSLNGEY